MKRRDLDGEVAGLDAARRVFLRTAGFGMLGLVAIPIGLSLTGRARAQEEGEGADDSGEVDDGDDSGDDDGDRDGDLDGDDEDDDDNQ